MERARILTPRVMLGVNVKRIYAGTSGALEYSLAGYSAAEGWASHVVLRNYETQEVITLDATGAGVDYVANYEAQDSAAWVVGKYRVYLYATKGATKNVIAEEVLQILPDPEGGAVKSADEVELEAVKKAIAGVLSGEGVKSYSFDTAAGRRSADRMDLAELRAHERHLVRKIQTAQALAEGRQDPHGFRTIAAKFNR